MNYSARQILLALAGSLLIAGACLITLVLPAEYGLDPLGTGKLLGLTGLAEREKTIVHPESGSLANDKITFELAPYESVEYKFELGADSSLSFNWQANVEVAYEFHGEPDAGPAGFAETYAAGKASSDAGTATLPFSGKHGWYFANRTFTNATITLTTSGFYSRVYAYRDGFVDVRDINN